MKKNKLTKLEKWVGKQAWLVYLLDKAKRQSLPGFGKIPVYDVLMFIYKELARNTLSVRANALAFSFLLSIFPTIIFIFTLLPYVPIQDFNTVVFAFLEEIMPVEAFKTVYETVNDIIVRPRGGLLSIGFIMAIIFSSNGMISMMNAFKKSYKTTFKKRNFLQTRLIAIQLTAMLAFLLMASVLLIFLGNHILYWLLETTRLTNFSYILLQWMKWIVIILLFYSVITLLYRNGASTKKKFPIVSAGATLATILSIFTCLAFSYFVNNFGQYNKFYGSIGTLIVLMIWLQLNCFILLVGYELNASIAVNQDLKLISIIEEE